MEIIYLEGKNQYANTHTKIKKQLDLFSEHTYFGFIFYAPSPLTHNLLRTKFKLSCHYLWGACSARHWTRCYICLRAGVSLSRVLLFAAPLTEARQTSLSSTISQSLLKFMSIESVMPSNHLILCHTLLLLPSVFPSIRVFSKESALHIR